MANDTDERALEAAWKAGKITKPVLRKAIAAALKGFEARKGGEND